MKTLCITGFAHPALSDIAENIFSSGLSAAKASQQQESMDIDGWHQRVIAKHAGVSGIGGVSQVGRLWEQLAADIFLNNLHTAAWGWCSPQSLFLLDFWEQFDPQIYFVLVCVSPQQALSEAIAHASSDLQPEQVLKDWYNAHQTLLRFHLRHPERSMLLMAEDALAAPQQLIEKLAADWSLPLQTHPRHSHSLRAANHGVHPDIVAGYLAQQLLADRSAEETLFQEIQACMTLLGNAPDASIHSSSSISVSAVISAHRQMYEQSQKVQALEQTQTQLRAELENSKDASERTTQLDALQTELTDVREEAELLLLQLHQVQEELEHYFLAHQQTLQTNEMLQNRLRRVYERMPDYSNYGSIKTTVAKKANTIDWHWKDLEISGKLIAQLHCRTQIVDGIALLRFIPLPGQSLPFLSTGDSSQPVDIAVGPNSIGPASALNALATSDIRLLSSMAQLLEQVFTTSVARQLPADFATEHLQQALALLPRHLQALPQRLRFDSVTLKNNHVVPGYEHLWLVLENLSWGQQTWTRFEFRVACANTETSFGTDPKLEFPQPTGASPLTSWFVESNDEYGDKLELRFAQPDAMDLSVWGQLSAADHDFLCALMGSIPAMLTALQNAKVSIDRKWQDWEQLVHATQHILNLRTQVEEESQQPVNATH